MKQVQEAGPNKKFPLKNVFHPGLKKLLFKFIPFYTLILFQLFSISCSKKSTENPVEPVLQSRGQVISSTLLGVYTAQRLSN